MTTNRIIIGGDDSELPDALDVSDLVPVPPQQSGASVDSRMRNRRIGVRRAAGRKRLVIALVILGVVLLGIAALAVLASPLFSVENVRLSGAVYTADDALAPILDEVEGQAILTVDTSDLREQIERLPWVRRAEASDRVATATSSNFTAANSRAKRSSPTRASWPAMPKRCRSA